jgi:hypothetical protein
MNPKNYPLVKSGIFIVMMLFSVYFVTGQNQYAISLDGSQSFGINDDASNHLDITTAYTFETWINVGSRVAANFECIMDRRTVFSLYLVDDDNNDYALTFARRGATDLIIASVDCDGSGSTSANMVYGIWYHVAATFDGTTAKLYINGVLYDSDTDVDWPMTASSNALNIGGRYWGSYSRQMSNADIDEIRVSNIARDISAMQTSTHWEEYTVDANTVLLMHLNDLGDSPAFDSGTGLTGTKFDNNITSSDYQDDLVSSANLLRPKYRSQTTGNWNSLSSWEVENGSDNYVDATFIPGIFNELIVLKNGHTITVDGAITSWDLEIESNAVLIISPNNSLTVVGILTNNAGSTGLVVEADATGNGSLIENSGVSATVEQYISPDAWHLVSSPITNAQAGVYTGLYLYEWIEADSAFTNIISTSYSLVAGHGYYAWSLGSIPSPTDVEFTGTLNTSDLPVTWMTYTPQGYTGWDGWNFAGNPYPSGLKWNNTWSQTSSLDPTVYVWDAAGSGNWLLYNYNTGLGSLTNGEIPPTQGFYVKANSSSPVPSMTIPASARVHTSAGFYKNSDFVNNNFELKLSSTENELSDRVTFGLNNDASWQFDNQFDAYKLWGTDEAPQLYSYDETTKYSISLFPEFTGTKTLQLGFRNGLFAEYSITPTGLENFDKNIEVFLEDQLTGDIVNMREVNEYSFIAEPGFNESRFLLHFNPEFTSINHPYGSDRIKIYAINNIICINSDLNDSGKILIYNITGGLIFEDELHSGLNQINLSSVSGYYIVKAVSSEVTETQKVFIK